MRTFHIYPPTNGKRKHTMDESEDLNTDISRRKLLKSMAAAILGLAIGAAFAGAGKKFSVRRPSTP